MPSTGVLLVAQLDKPKSLALCKVAQHKKRTVDTASDAELRAAPRFATTINAKKVQVKCDETYIRTSRSRSVLMDCVRAYSCSCAVAQTGLVIHIESSARM